MTTVRDRSFDDRGDPPAQCDGEQLLHESARTRVTRIPCANGEAVIRKEPLGSDAPKRIRHETMILERLAGIEGVPEIVSSEPGAAAIMLSDPGGTTLAERLSSARLALPQLLELAERLTDTVAAVHRRGVAHKDINPANIIITDAGGRPVLINYDLATVFAEERRGFTHQREIVGTLAYLAPEQTGRTGRPVDQRADLYALGATLYALATGRPPFDSSDPLQLIHDHLACVPVPPIALNPALPRALSDIILRLLEKEPDRRYQSAEGLAHDLARLCQLPVAGGSRLFPLGERDFPLRLTPPSRPVGRDAEVNSLRTAFESAVKGQSRGVLVAGAPGVGKTVLIDELRPIVTAGGGWFVTGKFDQYRQDNATDAVAQAFRALGRLLLAEPEAGLAALRSRILRGLGSNAGLLASLLPEFALLLDVAPEIAPMDPTEVQARLFRTSLDVLRMVVSPTRPVVMVIDDLQWAGSTPIGFIDAVLMDESLSGLLLVGAYREDEVDAAHPLSAMLSRWERLGTTPVKLTLRNLPPTDLGLLLEKMLRLPPDQAARLAGVLNARTGGNPYDTVELVNALRRDGALVPRPDGWAWHEPTLRRYVGTGDVVDLLTARIDELPPASRALLEIMACLGGEVETPLLHVAAGLSAATLEERLAPPLEDGLLVLQHGDARTDGAVRFRHDRVQQAAYGRLDHAARQLLHLTLARRLAAVPEFGSAAAQQYLPAVAVIRDLDERRHVADLFRAAAARSSLTNYTLAGDFLAGALELLDPIRAYLPEPPLAALETEWHAALYRLGRLEEADEIYRAIERRHPDPLDLTGPACVQISSLTNRGLTRDAVTLSLGLLRQLGLAVPRGDEAGAQIEQGLDELHHWITDDSYQHDVERPEITDPRIMAAAKVINRTMPPAFFCDQTIMAWLVIESRRLWAEYGPCAGLVGPIGHAGIVTIGLREDYRTGYSAVRHVLKVSEARAYEPETSQARFLFSVSAGHWFEPVEDAVVQAQRAHEGLLHGGDLHFACFTYHSTTPSLLDCTPTLDSYSTEVETGITFAARTGNDQTAACSLPFRQLVRTLRGETYTPGAFDDASFDETAHLAGLASNPMAAAYFHANRAMSAALFGNTADLVRHAAAAVPLLPYIQAAYTTARVHLLRALALAEQVKAGPPDEKAALLAELDECRDWLARRADDAPGNFRHLHRWVEAERAWAVGEDWGTARAFDAALHEGSHRQRPWHRALIAERAAAFHLDRGLRDAGHRLLAEARRLYHAWGATAKVREMGQEHPFLQAIDRVQHSVGSATTNVSSEAIDLLAVLKASQALSSETTLDGLRDRVVEVLSAMTGATSVLMLLWNEDAQEWLLPAQSRGNEAPITVDAAAALDLLPLAAFRYVERTREPLLIEDAARDDRVARDPYVVRLDRCSLLVVPILIHGAPRAVLMLENRLSRSVFSADRLDAVMLIAGQLAVSLDNAMVYASLERKVVERTEELAAANTRLELLTITDPLTGLANRRHLTEVLQSEWHRTLGMDSPLAAAMIDIDHFKLYNDHYGHPAGDACLRRVAEALRGTVRDTDLVTRYGGEEFAVVLPGADLATAVRIAERARAAVVALGEEHAAAAAGVVTVSVGVAAVVPSAFATADQLIERADAELYRAKRSGRNRVMADTV